MRVHLLSFARLKHSLDDPHTAVLERMPESRAVQITAAGRRGLERTFGVTTE